MADKIKAALLGDAAAAAECTAAGTAIPCPFCGETPGWHIAGENNDLLSFGCQGANNCVRWIIPFSPPYHTNALQIALRRWNRRAPVQSEDNPPLTLEELRELDCEPVWVDEISKPNEIRETRSKGYVLARWGYVQMVDDSGLLAYQLQFSDYERAWLAYRRKPEQEGET